MPSEGAPARPRLRVIHHLARSGGTVISRCLASMGGVVLLSEIHPLGAGLFRMFDPLRQAQAWYRLLTKSDLEIVRRGPVPFVQSIGLIARRCEEHGALLVLRDWSHLDYTGVPYAKPVYRSRLVEALQDDFELVRTSTVRHPLDQWLSLSSKPAFIGRLDAQRYLDGLERFAVEARTMGFARYEDFTRDADTVMASICAALDIEFDPGYRERWPNYRNITGDVLPGRSEPGRITQLPREAISAQQAEEFRARPQYRRIIELLGYDE